MIMYCKKCGQFVTWISRGNFSDEDDHGRIWAVWECPECAHREQYAVG